VLSIDIYHRYHIRWPEIRTSQSILKFGKTEHIFVIIRFQV